MRYKIQPKILLHPNIPKPLHLVNPRTILGSRWWDDTRQAAYAEMGFRCHACGVKRHETLRNRLEAHECYNISYSTGEVKYVKTCALCVECHSYIHDGRMQELVNSGIMPEEWMQHVMRRGRNLLRQAGCTVFKLPIPESSVAWSEWHLLLGGKKYYSKFRNFDEWKNYWEEENRKRKSK